MPPAARLALVPALALLIAGCALNRGDLSARVDTRGARLLRLAETQIGAPYRYGGDTPRGFDCSGLVRYVHAQAGLTVPRTAAGQMLAARRVPLDALAPGDLLFFASDGTQIDHVGIYAGDGRFLHAPRTGRPVGYDRLDDEWYAPRARAAGRFWTDDSAAGTSTPAP
jgi:cell wall-associated NlpC family hydrolase